MGRVFRFAAVAGMRTGVRPSLGPGFVSVSPQRGPNRSRPVPLPALVDLKGSRERFGQTCLLLAEGAKTLTRSGAPLEAACGPGRGLVSGGAGSSSKRRRHSRVLI